MRGKYNYNNVKKWSRKVIGGNIFALKRLFIPINLGQKHWALGVIHFVNKIIQYYDSMRGNGEPKCEGLLNYLKDEHKKQFKCELNTSDWTIDPHPKDVPQQRNGE